MRQINQLCRDLRTRTPHSQSWLAEKLGYSTSQFVSNWERDLCMPPFDAAKKMAKLFKVDVKAFRDAYQYDYTSELVAGLGIK